MNWFVAYILSGIIGFLIIPLIVHSILPKCDDDEKVPWLLSLPVLILIEVFLAVYACSVA